MKWRRNSTYLPYLWSLVGLVVAEESGRVGGDVRKRRKRALWIEGWNGD